MPTSDELLDLAEQCAAKLGIDGRHRHVPSFSDAEEACEDEYEALLQAIHEDELFASVDIQRQGELVEQIAAALPEGELAMSAVQNYLICHAESAEVACEDVETLAAEAQDSLLARRADGSAGLAGHAPLAAASVGEWFSVGL